MNSFYQTAEAIFATVRVVALLGPLTATVVANFHTARDPLVLRMRFIGARILQVEQMINDLAPWNGDILILIVANVHPANKDQISS